MVHPAEYGVHHLAATTASVFRMGGEDNAVPTAILSTTNEAEERAPTGLNKILSPFKGATAMVADAVKLRSWLSKDTPVADVLVALKISERVDDALTDPNLKTLSKYVDMFNEKYPNNQVSLFGTLAGHYGDNVVATALVNAKLAASTKADLHLRQFEHWFTTGKSAKDVFKLLEMADDGPRSLISCKLTTLEDYIKFSRIKNHHDSTNIFRVLRNGFGGDKDFAIMVSKAMDIPEAKLNAGIYQDALFERWFKSNMEPQDVLMTVFKIDDVATSGAREQSIVSQYKKYYEWELGIDQIPSFLGHVFRPR
ncbi:RXLR effector family, putative [Phytophthora infestans T30-4]|uniref:RXLR effector family, putative n=1 Tax=Phytophthora infestans (strain T30-4) TaxID=403677 RepID=D0P470_PHYIT|nr:RXLR effector family, putative [Phytophthora infestans T30-4]EEY63288.1 RXLR effector family, putative [Phytophthora infestans T30-4]|eukprot:XP_002894898.1 RXLR effector family, putative [Phytophthora infestans T30-4]